MLRRAITARHWMVGGMKIGNTLPIGSSAHHWCKNCQLLCFDGETSCAAGGSHISAGSGDNLMTSGQQADAQSGWKWCNKCYGLAYSEGPSDGVCPHGGTHNLGSSGNYSVLANVGPGRDRQDKWAWCRYCQQLWYSGGNGTGRCARSVTGGHTKDGSGACVLEFK